MRLQSKSRAQRAKKIAFVLQKKFPQKEISRKKMDLDRRCLAPHLRSSRWLVGSL